MNIIDGPYSKEIITYKNDAILGTTSQTPPANEIVDSLEEAFYKISRATTKNGICYLITNGICEALVSLSKNTRNYEPLTPNESDSLCRIINHLTDFHKDVVNSKSDAFLHIQQIESIRELLSENIADSNDTPLFHDNWRESLVFSRYDNLEAIIDEITSDFSIGPGTISTFLHAFKGISHSNINEYERLGLFLDVIDGKKKVVPVFTEALNNKVFAGYSIVNS